MGNHQKQGTFIYCHNNFIEKPDVWRKTTDDGALTAFYYVCSGHQDTLSVSNDEADILGQGGER